jgi:hypothetical protein
LKLAGKGIKSVYSGSEEIKPCNIRTFLINAFSNSVTGTSCTSAFSKKYREILGEVLAID